MRYVQVVSGEDTYFFHTMEEAFVKKAELERNGRRNVVVEEVK